MTHSVTVNSKTHIARFGAVMAFTGKVDVGQDNQTLVARHAPYRRFGPRQPGPPFTGGPS